MYFSTRTDREILAAPRSKLPRHGVPRRVRLSSRTSRPERPLPRPRGRTPRLRMPRLRIRSQRSSRSLLRPTSPSRLRRRPL
jgi:hypothetical protein